ncbi:protein TOPLESS-like isoform X8 [Solanum pennellii]|uniref:Protein TOPLESS-like isoform X8 n=1 Tax=Solanum pennellii TaxID=28526 RepID=A0ABM1V7R8_SOLPN|nr:protein TOPLESS-like isoform X8 [Solanum pennellii]
MLSWRVCFVINISSLVCFSCVGFDDSVSDYDSICLLQVSRLICTNSGDAILVLASNAINLLWKWLRNERNSGGKYCGNLQIGILMTNDVQEPNHEKVVSCFALSKNACYVISTSGGKISLFNMMTFKRVTMCPLL